MNQLAYLGIYEADDGSYTGGLLVCDARGLPVDFRYVEPVRPTKVQSLIYGAALRRYVMVEAIGAGLLEECTASYSITFIENDILFDLADRAKAPMVKLLKSSKSPLHEKGDWEKGENGEILFQAADGTKPVSIIIDKDDTQFAEGLMKDLKVVSESLDIMEPLERVGTAIGEIEKLNGELKD